MPTELKHNLEQILNDVNRFININKDRELYANHFKKLTEDFIFKELRKIELFGQLFNGYQLGGSYGDNLKVTKPNEFDLVFHVQFPENHLITVEADDTMPGNVHLNLTNVLKKIRNEKQHKNKIPYIEKWTDENGYLYIRKLQSYFESCFQKVLQSMNWQVLINGRTANLRYTKEGPAHTIHVDDNANMVYSVDFVPGILLKECQSVTSTHVGNWEAIPKPIPNLMYDYTSFRSSFYRQEQKIIGDKKNLKNALRIMKKFRDAHLNMNKMKSYFIKTLFLWKAKKEPNAMYWKNSLTNIIIDMFQAFEDSLYKKNLPFFWDERLNLYDNYNNRLLTEMLRTVQSARKTLYEAAVGELTIPLQNRVYALFLDRNERRPVMEVSQLIADIVQLAFDKKEQKVTEEKKSKDSSCIIL